MAFLKAIGGRNRPPTDEQLGEANRLCDGFVIFRWNANNGLHVWIRQYNVLDGKGWLDILPLSLTLWASYIEEVRRDGSGWVHKNKQGPAGHIDKATLLFGRRILTPESKPTWYQRVLMDDF